MSAKLRKPVEYKVATYPYCKIPMGYFDRLIYKQSKKAKNTSDRSLLDIVRYDGQPVFSCFAIN